MSIIALLAVAFVVLTTVRVPTRVRLEARVGQLGLTVADSKRGRALQILDETLPIHGLELRRFSRAEIDTNRGEEAPLAPWVFRAQTLAATLSVETPVPSLPHDRSSASQISALQDLALTPGDQLVLRAQRLGDDFDVGLDLARSQPLVLPLLNSVAVTATDVEQLLPESMATPQPGSASPMLYADPSPTARLIIYPGTLSLDIAMVVGGVRTGSRILWSEPLPVSSVDFIRSERDGTWRSTLLAEVALHRLDAPWLPPVEVPRDHFLSMDRLRDFQVRRLALDDASGGLVATLEGRVGLFKSGAAGKVRDLRLTAYERWLGNDRWSGLMVWLAGTTSVMFGAARFWQQRRRAA